MALRRAKRLLLPLLLILSEVPPAFTFGIWFWIGTTWTTPGPHGTGQYRALGFGINGFFFFIFFLIWEGLGFTCQALTLKPEAT
jgi:hypothetical protein